MRNSDEGQEFLVQLVGGGSQIPAEVSALRIFEVRRKRIKDEQGRVCEEVSEVEAQEQSGEVIC